MKRAALYARVSSDKQEREETIDSQLAHLRRLGEERGLAVLDRHVYLDDGYSGELLARPGLDRLRDDARDGLLDVVLVHCPDRLARRYPYQVVVIEEIEKYGCEVDFVNREIARTPEDQMLLAMQGVIAEYEHAKILERTRRGRLHKLQMGMLIVPSPPFGYRWVARQGAERGRVEVVEDQAVLVRQIFSWIEEEGLSILALRRRLWQARIPSPKGGICWAASMLQKMLRNRAYIGQFCLNRVMAVEPNNPVRPGVYRRSRKCSQRLRPVEEWIVVPGPAIVDRQVFDAVQQRLAANERFALRRARQDHQGLLRCLVRCGICGYSMTVSSRGPHGPRLSYYRCIKSNMPDRYADPTTKCSMESMRAEALDEVVWADLRTLMCDPGRIARHAGIDTESSHQPQQRAEVDRLGREIEACNRQLQRLLDAFQRGAVEMEDLLRRRKQIDDGKVVLLDRLKQAEATLHDEEVRRAMRSQLPDLVAQVRVALENAGFETRQRLVRLLIERVVVHSGHEVEIHYALPTTGHLPGGPPTDDGAQPTTSRPGPTRPVSGNCVLHPQLRGAEAGLGPASSPPTCARPLAAVVERPHEALLSLRPAAIPAPSDTAAVSYSAAKQDLGL